MIKGMTWAYLVAAVLGSGYIAHGMFTPKFMGQHNRRWGREEARVLVSLPLGPNWAVIGVTYSNQSGKALYICPAGATPRAGKLVLCETSGEAKLSWLGAYLGK